MKKFSFSQQQQQQQQSLLFFLYPEECLIKASKHQIVKQSESPSGVNK